MALPCGLHSITTTLDVDAEIIILAFNKFNKCDRILSNVAALECNLLIFSAF